MSISRTLILVVLLGLAVPIGLTMFAHPVYAEDEEDDAWTSEDTESEDTESEDTESEDTESEDTDGSDTLSSDTESEGAETNETESAETEAANTDNANPEAAETEAQAESTEEGKQNAGVLVIEFENKPRFQSSREVILTSQ